MKVIACVKVVPEEQDIAVLPSGDLSFDNAKPTISAFDLNALEAGSVLAEQNGAEFVAVSVGAANVNDSKTKKNILSRGPASMVMVADDALEGATSYQTACALAGAIGTIEGWDLVLCGAGSADRYAQQTGSQLAQLLGVACVNGVSAIEPGDGVVIVERTLENVVQRIEVPLPCVLTLTSDINRPRVATMKQILAAGKKPATVLSAADIAYAAGASTEVIDVKAPTATDRAQDIVAGDSDDDIQVFIGKLKNMLR